MQVAIRDVIIADIKDEAEGIRSFRLQSADGGPLPPTPAGAHIDVHLPNGSVRQYSLCQDPAETDTYLIAIKREPASRGGSQWFHENAAVGTRLGIGAPRSLLGVSPEAESHVLLAGGIGITPLYSMAMHFLAVGAPFELHYFARSKEHAAFAADLMSGPFASRTRLHLGLDNVGLPPALDDIFARCDSGSHLYMCGPPPFMDIVRTKAAGIWSADAIHEERFSAALVAADSPSGSFEVTLAKSGITFEVAANRSILDALMAHGHAIDHSCEQGFCGTCITALLEGEAEHCDTFLTPEEIESGQWIMPCVSRAKSARLVFDL